MMMECPRCAFVQPQDRFCANCGLNIATYQAKPKPLSQRLLSSPALYIALGIFFVFFIGWFLKQSKVAPVDRTVVEQSAPVSGGAMPGSPAPPPPPPSDVASSRVASPPAVPGPAPISPTAAPGFRRDSPAPGQTITANSASPAAPGADGDGTPAAAAPAAPAAKMPQQVDISFYEISREAWQPASVDGKSLGDQGGWRIVQFAVKDKLTTALGSARRLPGQRSMATQASSNASLHFPSGPAEARQGMFFDFSVVKAEAGNLEIEVSGQVALKLDATSEIQSRVESVAAMPAAGAVVMLGSFARKTPPESVAGLLSGSPLSVLNSLDFVEGQSEIILVITGR